MGNVKRRFRLRAPINVYTVTTHRCHTDCLYCYADRKKTAEMPLSRWRELIAEMARLGIRLCSPDNGETFARKDGIDILECMIEHKMHFLLSTKAHLTRDIVGRLFEAGFKEKINGVIDRPVQLSVDAVDNDIAKRILNVRKPRVDLAADTFANFMHHGIMPIIKCVVTGLNYDQIRRIVDYFYPRGARLYLCALHPLVPPAHRRSVPNADPPRGAGGAVRRHPHPLSRYHSEREHVDGAQRRDRPDA